MHKQADGESKTDPTIKINDQETGIELHGYAFPFLVWWVNFFGYTTKNISLLVINSRMPLVRN